MKRIFMGLLLSLFLVGLVFASDSAYIVSFTASDVTTLAGSGKVAITLPTPAVKVVKIWGGVHQGDTCTQYDLAFFSDNVASTVREDTLFRADDITTEYYIYDTETWLSGTGTTGKSKGIAGSTTVYYVITNDSDSSTTSDITINLLVEGSTTK